MVLKERRSLTSKAMTSPHNIQSYGVYVPELNVVITLSESQLR